ncbi:zinc finger protein CG2199 [Drosophila subpulchrella]|uniref:zinc finger protein CG2199 n=1 Tax=Drosophila subpulchrella TaxID=1486046 RepID=UPI0018A15AFE|nr:zinc finger protein CG2199 [Drosophila subpulchrella]
MASKAKKEVLCDHCHEGYEAKMVYTAQKTFVGTKVVDLLEAITHKSIPPNANVKICFICASGFMSTRALIDKVRETVDRILAAPAKKGRVSKAAAQDAQDQGSADEPAPDIVDLTAETEKTPAKPQPKKNTTIRQRSKSVAFPASHMVPDLAGVANIKASPAKRQLSRLLGDSLDDSVKLTPAKDVSSSKKAFLNLFGNGDDAMEKEFETESEEGEEAEAGYLTINTNNFQCAECEFHTRFPNYIKEHMLKEHGQQRARIYSCPMCTKNFGVLKTIKDHVRDVHSRVLISEAEAKTKANNKGKPNESEADPKPKSQTKKPKVPETQKQKKKPKEAKSKAKKAEAAAESKSKKKPTEVEAEKDIVVSQEKPDDTQDPKVALLKSEEKTVLSQEKAVETPEPKVASFKALNESLMRKRMLENVLDSEYTFAINGSSASTPRAESTNFQCDICDCELATAKQMQDHMKTAHAIDKPKVFKCHVCEKSLTTKQSLKTHQALHSDGAEVGKSTKRKILQEEDEDVDIEGSFEKNKTIEDDEGPREEKIVREKPSKDTSLKLGQSKVGGLMSAPLSPVKKAKKGKASLLDVSGVTTNGESPSKRKKQVKSEETSSISISDVSQLEEINHNVKPHKKARLESVGDSTTDESVLSCDQCGKSVGSRQRLDSHIQKKHISQLKCPKCKDVFTQQLNYVSHFSDCLTDNGLPCGVDKCTKVFTEANYLSSHLRKRHHCS